MKILSCYTTSMMSADVPEAKCPNCNKIGAYVSTTTQFGTRGDWFWKRYFNFISYSYYCPHCNHGFIQTIEKEIFGVVRP